MRLVRFGEKGKEKPGLLDSQDIIRDLSGILSDIDASTFTPSSLAHLQDIDPSTLPAVEGNPRLGTPLRVTGKFLAIGLNYRDHAQEANLPIPSEPIVFMKANSCVTGPHDEIILPPDSKKTDWEVELGIVIGSEGAYLEKKDALAYVAGYVLVNDVSERAYQLERGGTWDKGKSCDSFGPIGPWFITKDEIGDVQNLSMWLEVNGVRRQTGNTATMIFDVPTIVAYISQFMRLYPGDIITTGTPPGVGMGIKPTPVFLEENDIVTLGIEKLGQQRQACVRYKG
ncbi:fumarylacetoacetate hydrolase family protein [Pseudomonas umsongensis]|uniref:2-hydroxyhepta-2,4-diene-1,7-dioate isomerase n=1 Tax=Pseudomonas umsongensis TaxID=198618 RepID=A0ABX4E1B1_9PSED|nr:fumarylacetoacetate hydrolase family protein [Pseudomonas umsongensis]OXR35450.1 2-hydroxyhepta-2,4-diene-1,7-dioate isomerase [Pseudomonas umsongensis]QFG29784.1 fumarylacetoacetate hydrolase family protein [Pseudomonas umsongensis]SDT34497.1 2-keto-4-pentenoate hydratase/2-oxohepta-3-ene-1,7-dioic acid hydratase (catechol pathway) [Pseudomonas umsongensis]